MKSLYEKGMNVEQLKDAAHKSWVMLHAVDSFLNEQGKAAKITHAIIEDCCSESISIEDLRNNLKAEIEERRNEKKVVSKLNFFIHNFLDENEEQK